MWSSDALFPQHCFLYLSLAANSIPISIVGQTDAVVGGRGRVAIRDDGCFRIECALRPAASVDLGPSACFWENVGQNASECMLPQAARGLPFRTLRVKCLVDGVRFGGLPGRYAPKAAGSRPGACTRWQNDQHFFEITHSRRK